MEDIWKNESTELNKLLEIIIPSKSMRQIHSHRQKFKSKGKLNDLIRNFQVYYKPKIDFLKQNYFLNRYDNNQKEKKEVHIQIKQMLLDSKFESYYSNSLSGLRDNSMNILINSTSYPVLIGNDTQARSIELHFTDVNYFEAKDEDTLKQIKWAPEFRSQANPNLENSQKDLVMPNLIERYLNFYGSTKTHEIMSNFKDKKETTFFNPDLLSMMNCPKTPNDGFDSNLSMKKLYWSNPFMKYDHEGISLRSRIGRNNNNFNQAQNFKNMSSTSLFCIPNSNNKSPVSYNRFTVKAKSSLLNNGESPMGIPTSGYNLNKSLLGDSTFLRRSPNFWISSTEKAIHADHSLSSFSKTQASKSQKSIISEFTVK